MSTCNGVQSNRTRRQFACDAKLLEKQLAMKRPPADQIRLVGDLPSFWSLRTTNEGFEIVPDKAPRAMLVFFALMALGGPIGAPIAIRYMPETRPAAICVFALGWFVIALVMGGVFSSIYSSEHARGPILQLSRSRREIFLPRTGQALSYDQVLHWDVVGGFWTKARGRYDKATFSGDAHCELQLVVRDASNEPTLIPLLVECPAVMTASSAIQRFGWPTRQNGHSFTSPSHEYFSLEIRPPGSVQCTLESVRRRPVGAERVNSVAAALRCSLPQQAGSMSRRTIEDLWCHALASGVSM